MKYLLIGNSTAAVAAAEAIRAADGAGEITMLSREPEHTYSRPLISYLLKGKTDERRMRYRPADFYEQNRITLRYGEAAAIDADAHAVTLSDGETLPYDRLLVATGSRPFVPPIPGLETVGNRFTFMSLADARALGEALRPDARVLIMGAGLIGLKCAEGIHDRVGSITVVDLADRVLPSILTAEAAAPVQSHLEKQGVSFILSDGVASFDGGAATLKSGRTVDFDLLVIAVGVRPETELVSRAGGAVERGIVTDETGLTTLPDVYAAGDCTQCLDAASGQTKILALLPCAYMQGETAGIRMSGGEKTPQPAIPMNAIGFMGMHMVTAGSYEGEQILREKPGKSFKQLFVKDGYLKGFIMLGDVRRAGIYTNIIRNRIPLSQLDFELLRDKPQLIAFSKGFRAQKLGGAV